MATWYWVAAAPANFATANWATTSGGAASGTPATGDTAIFDSHSSQTCTIAAAVSLASLDCQGGTGNFVGTLNHGGFIVTISVAGAAAFRLAPGMIYVATSAAATVTFTNTAGIAALTSAGQALQNLTINGAGGTIQQQDNLVLGYGALVGALLTLTAGTFDCNGHALTAPQFSSNNTNTRAFILGSSLSIGGNVANGQAVFSITNTVGLTFTKNAANITVLTPTTAGQGNWTFQAQLTFNGLIVNAASVPTTFYIAVAATFASLAVGQGVSLILAANNTFTISTAFTLTGTATLPIGMISTQGGVATISCPSGACSITWGGISNITATGGATFAGVNALQLGSTANWSITPPGGGGATAAQVATAVWEDTFGGGDFATAGSVGALMAAMQNLQFTVPAMARGTVGSGGTMTSVPTSAFNLLGAGPNRAILFDAATTTAALQGAASAITATTGGATPTLTVSPALAVAPASGDTFSVI
jgi:hypothetical protein